MQNLKSRMLAVDDEPEIVDRLTNFFSRKGYEVNSAYSGEEAIEILENKGIDLVLLDLRLPGIQGIELAKIIRKKYPMTKIIIVTAYAGQNQDALNSGISDGIFNKPVVLQELYKKLLDILAEDNIYILDSVSQQELQKTILLVKFIILLKIRDFSLQKFKYN
jgi:CheY-like chemotaxis protein